MIASDPVSYRASVFAWTLFGLGILTLMSGCLTDGKGHRPVLPPQDATDTSDPLTLLSRGADGKAGGGFNCLMSADGNQVLFETTGALAGTTEPEPGGTVLVVKDLRTGAIDPVNLNLAGKPARLQFGISMSADGRFVSFLSAESGIVPDDTNGTTDVFLRDRVTRTTVRAVVATDGSQLPFGAFNGVLSGNGQFIVFTHSVSDLLPGGPVGAGSNGVFRRDLTTGEIRRIDLTPAGDGANESAFSIPGVSHDGRRIAFASFATDLAAGGVDNFAQIYLFDESSGISLVSVSQTGERGNDHSALNVFPGPMLSGDGSVVIFSSLASNLVPGDTPGTLDLFMHDTRTHRSVALNRRGDGSSASGSATGFEVSMDRTGSVIAFSTAIQLDAGPTQNHYTYIHRGSASSIQRLLPEHAGDSARFSSPSLTADGRRVAIAVGNVDLVAEDTNNDNDIYLTNVEPRGNN